MMILCDPRKVAINDKEYLPTVDVIINGKNEKGVKNPCGNVGEDVAK